MRKRRVATVVIIAGGVGLLIGAILGAKFPGSDTFDPDAAIPPVWTKDGDLQLSLALNLLLLGLADWHFRRFGLGKLVVIGLLAAVFLMTSVFDPGSGDPVWSRDGYSGDELVGIWLFIASAVAALIGVLWSYFSERPAGSKTLWQYLFGGGPAGSNLAPSQPGIIVDEGQSPPEGWQPASDGKWYSPGQHPDHVPPPPGPKTP